MGKNRTVQKTRVKNLENRMEELFEVDYEEESDLENDGDPNQVHISSHIDTSESNPQNLEILKIYREF